MTENSQVNEETALKNRTYLYYKSIFDKYDKDHDGFLTVNELIDLVESREYEHDIPPHVIKQIHDIHDKNGDRRLDYDEFVEMINNQQFRYLFGHYITRYINWIVPQIGHPSRTATDGLYEEEYTCNPPPVGMIIISIIEIIAFLVDELLNSKNPYENGPVQNSLIYEPCNRQQVWRYLTYMFIHIGPFHLVVNLFVQILLGIPLEMVHRWWRVLLVYFAGVIAGSLGTSVTDPNVKLAGASGGVYSLITAHIASILMNWREMSFPAAQLLIFLLVAGTDIGTAIYNRYVLDVDEHIGYAAHFAGAVAGLLVGINVLRNLSITRTERIIWWVSMVTFIILMGACIIWNFAWDGFCPKRH